MQVTIDGRTASVTPETTVLEAARSVGIKIPSLCYHPKTGKAGRCRACVVEIDGMRGLQVSCATAVRDGMSIHTRTETVLAARKMVVELLLADGAHNCLACEKNGGCELQDMAYDLGIEAPAFIIEDRAAENDASSEMIVIDRRKCIECGRCVSACQNVVVNEVLSMAHRGAQTQIVCDADRPMADSTCVQCGECSQLCPVGAILPKKSIGQGRPWALEMVDTTCPYCGVGCQVTLHVDKAANKIVKVTGREVEPNDGMLCVKGRYGYEFPSSPNRLTQPLMLKNGEHVPVTWDEALDFVADRIKTIVAASGPDVFSAFGSGRITNENNYAIAKFARAVVKTNNVDHCART
jgi:formate dehydrogenase major subunit